MRKYSKLMVVFAMVFTLASCGGSNSNDEKGTITTSPITEDGYRIAIPFKSSDSTQIHIAFNRGNYDIEAANKGLQRYAKEYFSSKDYYLQDGKLLDTDILGRKSGDNPFGLNPEKDSSLPINNSDSITVGSSTIPVLDVFEYNFYTDLEKDAEIKGLAFAIILNPNIIDAAGVTHEIKDDQLKLIGEEAGRKLMTYMKDLPEVGSNTPVMIALFKASSDDDNLPGTFISKGYGKNSIDQFTSIDEKWAMIPSDRASAIDPQIVSQFNLVKSSLFEFLPNNVDMIGKGFFIDNQIQELRITVTTQGKTGIQNDALIQYLKELLNNFSGLEFKIVVKINSNTETIAMIQREKSSNDISIIME